MAVRELNKEELEFCAASPNFSYGDGGAASRAKRDRREALAGMRQLVDRLERQNRGNFTQAEDKEFRELKATVKAADATLKAASYLSDPETDDVFRQWAKTIEPKTVQPRVKCSVIDCERSCRSCVRRDMASWPRVVRLRPRVATRKCVKR